MIKSAQTIAHACNLCSLSPSYSATQVRLAHCRIWLSPRAILLSPSSAIGFCLLRFCSLHSIRADVLLLAMVELHMRFLGVHGDPLRGLFLHILGWTLALDLSGGITGINLKMNEALVSTSSGNLPTVTSLVNSSIYILNRLAL